MSHQCLHSTNLHIVFMRMLPAKMLIFRNSLGSGRVVLLVARPIVDTGWDWLYGVNKQQTIILLNNSHCLIKHNNTTMVQHFINIFTIVLLQHKNFFYLLRQIHITRTFYTDIKQVQLMLYFTIVIRWKEKN